MQFSTRTGGLPGGRAQPPAMQGCQGPDSVPAAHPRPDHHPHLKTLDEVFQNHTYERASPSLRLTSACISASYYSYLLIGLPLASYLDKCTTINIIYWILKL